MRYKVHERLVSKLCTQCTLMLMATYPYVVGYLSSLRCVP